MYRLRIIIASTRPGRKGPAVTAWLERAARAHEGFDCDVLDLAEVGLPLLDEPEHPSLRNYHHAHTRAWSEMVNEADAFIIVLPEYNHGYPASIKNALDYVFHEWHYKPAGLVSYGGIAGGIRSAELIKPVLTTLRMVPLNEAVPLPFFTQHMSEEGTFEPPAEIEDSVRGMLDEMLRVAEALEPLRERKRKELTG
ncbi:MAG TPA: NAD(P)H-dependent oxidoreductase [Gammaproteobacteria bacterium]|nr:NAD(P)H-dependent oxidoreductase [Gammaproteobacteria bacterium]